MKKKTFAIVLTSALLFSLVGAHVVGSAEANPYSFFWEWVDPPPGTIPPKITITSPRNYTTYSSGDLNLTIHITGPQTPTPAESSGIFWAGYTLDGDYKTFKGALEELVPEVDHSEVLDGLRNGNHELMVEAHGAVELGDFKVSILDSNTTILFSIGSSISSPNPTPSISPSPNPAPTGTPVPTPKPIPLAETFPTTLLAGSTMVAVVSLGFLVYFKKRHRSKELLYG